MVSNLKEVFSDLKTDLIKNAERQIKDTFMEPELVTSFSSILKKKTKPAVIIEPKNPEQNFAQTKTDTASTIDPANEKIQIAKMKSTENGGMLVGCLSSDQNLRFKSVGSTILNFWVTKKKRSTYQALLQVDKKSYGRLMAAGGLFTGYGYCMAFDGLDANRCFNCNNFGHTSRVCKKKISCTKSSCEHKLSACVAENLKCINCIRISIKEGKQFDTSHVVWDHSCPVYKSALEKLKSGIFST
ncbi:hypothetical protein Zmor_017986 [Zophobas morio]|uniref:CCHC-type domain-containing protein n=1 Tax=Zophobas morio TaxID=2755281 RepID=A0AA38MDE9_9CUCU|nr:hypothetical protein Zmor_017986 [Zophobas morio]